VKISCCSRYLGETLGKEVSKKLNKQRQRTIDIP
jgi:hypothetical protein